MGLQTGRVNDGVGIVFSSCYVYNNIVVYSLAVTTNVELNSGQTGVASVPNTIKPKKITPFVCNVGGNIRYGYIETGGGVQIIHGGIPSGTTIIGQCVYAI